MKVTFQPKGPTLDELLPDEAARRAFEQEIADGMRRVADRWKKEAVENAPRSPSSTMLRKLHKGGGTYTTKATKKMGPKVLKLTDFYRMSAASLSARKKGTYAGPAGGLKERLAGANWKNPGGLERSIECFSSNDKAEVFVASNAEAGRYAAIIHDQKGVKWRERGPGTQAKGEQADEKFIERAMPAAQERLGKIIKKAIKAFFRSG